MIETARLVPGSFTPVGDGMNRAQRCMLELPCGRRQIAILKRMPRRHVVAEAFSAMLLRAWGLSVPAPYLVVDGDGLHFASADAACPSLKEHLGLQHMPAGATRDALLLAACHIVSDAQETPLAVAADEAIDNRDRNLGNVLWDGENIAWIDHELALGLATHLPDVNQLAIMAQLAGKADRMRRSTAALSRSLDRQAPKQAGFAINANDHACQVINRLQSLDQRLQARFPTKKRPVTTE